jgi:N-acetylmuramoyl-L-alanine amidase
MYWGILHGVTYRLSIGTPRWSWILRSHDETTVRGRTVVHGAGKTVPFDLFISLHGEGFPSRRPRGVVGSFINDRNADASQHAGAAPSRDGRTA